MPPNEDPNADPNADPKKEKHTPAPEVDYSKIGSIIDEAVGKQIGRIESKVSELARSQETDGSDDDEDEFGLGDLDEDSVLTGKDVARLLKKQEKDIESKIETKIQSSLTGATTRAIQDAKVFKDFPMLDQNSSQYDKEFHTQVQREIATRKSNGRDAEDPYLLYDSASSVYAQNPKWQKIRLESNVDEFQRRQNNREDSFTSRGRTNAKGGVPSASQIALAEKMGFSKDKLAAQFKKRS